MWCGGYGCHPYYSGKTWMLMFWICQKRLIYHPLLMFLIWRSITHHSQILKNIRGRSPTRGMCWTILGPTTWAIWSERNRMKHESKSLLPLELTRLKEGGSGYIFLYFFKIFWYSLLPFTLLVESSNLPWFLFNFNQQLIFVRSIASYNMDYEDSHQQK